MFRQHSQDFIRTIEPLFLKMTLGIHRRSFDGQYLVHFIIFIEKGGLCGIFILVFYTTRNVHLCSCEY